MNEDELDGASVTETDPTQTTPVDSTPDLSAGGETVSETPAISAAPEVPEQPEWRGIRDVMRERGYASQHEDDASALEDLIQQAQRARQYEPYYQQMAQHWTPFQQYLASQNQSKQAPQSAAEPPKSYWDKLPEYDPNWVNMVQRNEQGQLVAVPGAQPDLPQKIQAYARAKEAALAKLLADPVEATWPGFQQKMESVIKPLQEQIQRLEQQRANESVSQYVAQNAQYLFQHDEQGRQLVDPATGQPAFTPYGQAFAHYMNQAVQIGIPLPAQREQYARSLAVAWVQGQQQQAPQPASPPAKRPNGLAHAARNPNQSGTDSLARAANGKGRVNQNNRLSVGEQLQQAIVREYGSMDSLEQAMAN